MGLKLGSEGGVPRAPPPTRLVPDGQLAVAIRGGLASVATPETDAVSTTVWAGPPVEHMAKLVTWVLNPAASAGAADSHTVANTGSNVATSALPALIVTLPTRNSTTALLPARPSDGPLTNDRILASRQVSSHLDQRMSTGTTRV